MMNPLAMITLTAPVMLTGLMLIALPVIAHLMNRRARRRVVFPSIQLLKVAAASQSSLFKMRRWWLLLLRCLAVLAVVLAFAQPLWLGHKAQATGGNGSAVVILIDLSASAGQQYAGVSAIHSIRADATRVLDELTPGRDSANIVYATARPYTAFPSMTSNVDVLRQELDALEPTNERADLAGAIALAGQMLAEQAGHRRLVILSDLQASNWDEAMEHLPKARAFPEGTGVSVLAPDHAPPGNFALHDPKASPASPRIGQLMRLGVSVTNHSDRPGSVSVGLIVNGQLIDQKPVQVEARATIQVVFEPIYEGIDFTRVEITLPGDALAVDDRCYLSLVAEDRPAVVVFTDDDVDDPGTAGYFLLRALAPYGDQRDVLDVMHDHSALVSWPDLDRAAAIVLGEVGVLTQERVTALHRYMQDGGVVIYSLGRGAVAENILAMQQLSDKDTPKWLPVAPLSMGEAITITGGDWRAPLLKPFDEVGRSVLADISIRRAWAIGAVGEQNNRLLWYADGTPALMWQDVGAGRLVLANFGVSARDSDIGKHGLFVALLHGLVDELRTTHELYTHTVGGLVNAETGKPINASGPTPLTERPDGRPMRDVTYSINANQSVVSLDAPAAPGFYTTRQGEDTIALTAVNIEPRESDLRRVSADQLQRLLTTDDISAESLPSNAGASLGLHGNPIWGWLVLIAMVCLGVEMLLLGAFRS